MIWKEKCRRGWHWLVIIDYYLAAFLLLAAGISKVRSSEVSELLLTIFEQGLVDFSTIIFISRWQPWFEIALAALALTAWRPDRFAKAMAILYLFFSFLILYAAQGLLALPIDCGCFAEGEGTPAYLLLLRNITIAVPLFWVQASRRLSFSKNH
jgi:hypothetical protein